MATSALLFCHFFNLVSLLVKYSIDDVWSFNVLALVTKVLDVPVIVFFNSVTLFINISFEVVKASNASNPVLKAKNLTSLKGHYR